MFWFQCTKYLHLIELLKNGQETTPDSNQVEHQLFDRWPIDWHTAYEAHYEALLAPGMDEHFTEPENSLEPEPIKYIYESKERYGIFLKRCMKPCIGMKSFNRFCSNTESLNDHFSIDDEALCVLVIMNSYDKWKDEVEWKKDNRTLVNVPIEASKNFRKTLYTDSQCKSNLFSFFMNTIETFDTNISL